MPHRIDSSWHRPPAQVSHLSHASHMQIMKVLCNNCMPFAFGKHLSTAIIIRILSQYNDMYTVRALDGILKCKSSESCHKPPASTALCANSSHTFVAVSFYDDDRNIIHLPFAKHPALHTSSAHQSV